MSRRVTNLLLFGFLIGAFLSGWVTFAIGTGWVRLAAIIHGVLGFGVVALVPWKSVIVRDGLRRNQGSAATSLALMLMVAITVVSGALFSITGVRSYGPLTAIQVHVGSGVMAVLLTVVHVAQRPVRPHRVDFTRRALLRTGAVVGAAGTAYLGLVGATSLLRLPGRERRTTGSYERGSGNPAAMPVTSWINDTTPAIDPEAWRLQIGETAWTVDDLAAFGDSVTAILDCTGGWWSEQDWTGVRLDRLVEGRGGRSVLVRSATGYRRRFPLSDAPTLLLATHAGGEPLSAGHGAPARLVAPGRRGFWWVKWVTGIEVSDREWWVQSPFPLT